MGDPAKRHVPYPDDPDRSILNKREFRSTMSARQDNRGCGSVSSKFDLSAAQSFVSAFMGPMTPYKSVLLFHAVGVGKTCSAIQIAEAHSGMKHSFVIAPQTTKSGFKNNIVDTRRVPLNEDGFVDFPAHARQSCTGSTYTAVSHGKNFTKGDLRNAASQRVSSRYKFFGYEQFSNVLESTLDRVREKFSGLTDEELKPEIDAVLSDIYSDRVVVVDEAHNLRASNKNNSKTVLDDLRTVVSSARNIQLILLTATPMYNRHDEIIDLLNLLLLNDGKPELPASIFDSNGFLTPDGRKKLATAAFGRVSHMRGDNPDTFPLRITSVQAKLTRPFPPPSLDVNGNPIQPLKRLATGTLHYSLLSPIQKGIYDKLRANDDFDASVRWNSVFQQHCNITYGGTEVGEAGFRKAFQTRGTDTNLRVSYRSKRILSQKLIRQYSPKIAEVVSSVMRSEGPVFVYSRYKWAGVIPAAIALEEVGYAPITGKPILADAKPRDDAPRYAMITSNDNFAATGMSVGTIVARVNSETSNVKVVLGTLKAAEGLDFKRIREVHVIDPWHHMNITEQIVGRSVRFCSHASLAPEKRNVTIFLHCTAFSEDPARGETNDEFMYRNAFNKLKKIGQVSRVLKESAIDCSVLRKDLYIPPRGNVDVVTSHGKRVSVPVGDLDGSAVCDYGQCSPPCPNVPVARLDYSTFHPYFVKHMVEMMGWDIRDAMKDRLSMTYSQLSDVLGNPDDMILSLALESLLNPFLSGKWLGRNVLLYVSNVYIMVPSQLANTNFTMEEKMLGAAAASVASAVGPAAVSILSKLITLLVFLILAGMVVFAFVVLNHMPPRSWKLSHVGENTAGEIMEMTRSMVAKLDVEYGDEIQAWFRQQQDGNTGTYRNILKEWHIRADESYITRTYVMANAIIPENTEEKCSNVDTGFLLCDVFMGKDCEDFEMTCERPTAADYDPRDYTNQDVVPKNFAEKVFDGCPRMGTPPCYEVNDADRKRDKDLFFGTPGPLNTETLPEDFKIWFNLSENDPVKPIMEEDKPMLRSIENVELFLAALPWFLQSVKSRYSIFRYCEPEEIHYSKEFVDGKTADMTMFIRKYRVFRGDAESLDVLRCKLQSGEGIIETTKTDLFHAVSQDTRMMRAILSGLPISARQDMDDKPSLKNKVMESISRPQKNNSVLMLAHSCANCLEAAESDLRSSLERLGAGDIPGVRRHVKDATLDFSNALNRLASIKDAVDSKLNILSMSVYPELEHRKTFWNDISDLLNYDEEDIQEAYDTVVNIDERTIMTECEGIAGLKKRWQVLEADYKRFINLVHAVVYTGTYVVESKKYANIYHINQEVAKRFYEIVSNDLRCAYVQKNTFKPHLSELGMSYNVQSVRELCGTYWKWREMLDGLLEGMKTTIDKTTAACGF